MNQSDGYNRRTIVEIRANGGQVEGHTHLLLLTHTGARSGERRATPMGYTPDDERLIVIASNFGAPTHPNWYHNLVAHPDVTVEVGTETFAATAVVTEGAAERERLWTKAVDLHPYLVPQQAKTSRLLPVIALSRRAD
jgi:deazaflavin-dependent oxidoreductase (nitroreductase family)